MASIYGMQFGRLLLRAAMTMLLLIVATVHGVAQTVILESRILSGTDDAEERATGSVKLGSSDLEFTFDRNDQTVGMRFTGQSIPPGATITNAYIQFMVDNVDTVATSLTIKGEISENAATFVKQSGNITSRARTTAAVSWSPPPWETSGEMGVDQRTPDLAPLIQEIVNLPGWSAGNALVIIIDGTGERTADSFNGNPAGAPLLHVEYQTGSVNELATVTVTTPSSGSGHTVDRAIAFNGTANDPEDGDLTANIVWTSSLEGAIGIGGSISPSTLSLGTHTITASATDSGGRTSSADIDITVNPDALPLVTIANPASGSEHTETYDVLFSGTASDPEDGDLTASIAWSSSLDGAIGTGASFSTSALSLGTHTITASATAPAPPTSTSR